MVGWRPVGAQGLAVAVRTGAVLRTADVGTLPLAVGACARFVGPPLAVVAVVGTSRRGAAAELAVLEGWPTGTVGEGAGARPGAEAREAPSPHAAKSKPGPLSANTRDQRRRLVAFCAPSRMALNPSWEQYWLGGDRTAPRCIGRIRWSFLPSGVPPCCICAWWFRQHRLRRHIREPRSPVGCS